MIYQQKQLVSKILTQMKERNLDLLLAPVFPFPACRLNDTDMLFGNIDHSKYVHSNSDYIYCITGAVEYTMIWNFVDFPAGVIPFGIESGRNIDNYDDEGDALLRLAKEVLVYLTKTP